MSSLPLPVAALAAASHVAPALAAPFFRRMMLTPRRNVRPAPRLDLPTADERLDLGDGLVAWRWNAAEPDAPLVLLIHGFEGHRTQFGAIVEALLAAGCSAVALDVPAHGDSSGSELTAVQFVAAIERAFARLAPVHAVIGHSFGGAMALFTLAVHGGASRAVLISAPSAVGRELRRFSAAVGLSQRGTHAFIRSVEDHVGRPASDFDVRQIAEALDLPILLVHDQTDRQVPVLESSRSAHFLRSAELMVTRGLGHNRLLADPSVVEAVVTFAAARDAKERRAAN